MTKIILASKSPRRQELLTQMDVDFRIVLKDVDESYPDGLTPTEIAVYIAEKKALAFDEEAGDEIVITADTIVEIDGLILGKPETPEHAVEMLKLLSGRVHRVVTGVCLMYKGHVNKFFDVSEVFFRKLTDAEIVNYVEKYKPMDKAGSYGIQEWIGVTAIERINGSYTNVVGLPTEKVYQQLLKMAAL
ncbi:septum formation protein Maf [Mucilaginibacter mali]|uniref:dTTP/UTP pyrophosphatase n=1 Tax=Mucilaginibacter mali TaxID=2740462 RepID=A0A7D4ULB5_9SPHI|nr:Maf family nucleotide pyrophosphatase [Mucilaginibacter mali]QKJ29601.1 septum formation protein Maf [Mucilaginibacter mali]